MHVLVPRQHGDTHNLSSLIMSVMQVGFASLALQVSSVETGTCEAKVTRKGLFGDIRVQWEAGYPPGQALPGFRAGAITPSSGNANVKHNCASVLNFFFSSFNLQDKLFEHNGMVIECTISPHSSAHY